MSAANPQRLLILQPRRIGDVIVTTPVIDALRARFPNARIEFLVEPVAAPVLADYPGLDEALVFDKKNFFYWVREIRRRRYDWVLDFMNNPRTAQLTWASGAPLRAGFRVPFWRLAYTHPVDRPTRTLYAVQNKFHLLRAVGVTPPESGILPRLPVSEKDFSGARSWWTENALDRYAERVALMPQHRHPIRQWPNHRFLELMKLLIAPDHRALILFGSPDEMNDLHRLAAEFPERVFVIPNGPLRQAAALFARCHAAVTNDSGLMHLAVSVGVPTVTVYGPTSPDSWNPNQPPHRWVRAEGLACLTCNRDHCPYGHECMEWVPAARVAREVEAVLTEIRNRRS